MANKKGGQPPALYQFKPGQSGNAGGVPKGKKLSTVLRDILAMTAEELEKFRSRKDLTVGELIALRWAECLGKMTPQAGSALLNTALDRHEGAVAQTTILKSPVDRTQKTPEEIAAIAARCQKKPKPAA